MQFQHAGVLAFLPIAAAALFMWIQPARASQLAYEGFAPSFPI